MKFLRIIALSTLAWFVAGAQTQPPPATAAARSQVAGTVTKLDASAKQIVLKTDKGESVTVTTTDRSFFRRMPAGVTDTKKAVSIALGDIANGDRAVAIGQNSQDQKSFEARTIYIMSQSDVEQIHAQEQEDWQKRGTAGTVSALDPASRTVTIKVGQRQYTVKPDEKTAFLRYALDSAKLSDAKPGTFADIKVGDELHVLGNHGADGDSIAAEKILSGSFRQIAATVETIDPQTGSVRVKDLATKKPVFVRVNADSNLKKLPEQMAASLARRYQNAAGGQGDQGGQGGFGGRRGGGGSGDAGPAGAGARGPGGAGGFGLPSGGRGDIKQMLDRLPALPLTDLKPGDAIMISTTEGTDPTHLTLITLLAGVEPLLTASPNSTRDIMSGWNLGGGGGGGEGN